MMRDIFSFSDPEILKIIGIVQENGETSIYSQPIKMNDGDWIEFSLSKKMPQPRPPSLDSHFEWRLRVWDSSPIVVAAAVWDNQPKISPSFIRIYQGMWSKCSESEMRDFLMKRSSQLAEWFLWNLV